MWSSPLRRQWVVHTYEARMSPDTVAGTNSQVLLEQNRPFHKPLIIDEYHSKGRLMQSHAHRTSLRIIRSQRSSAVHGIGVVQDAMIGKTHILRIDIPTSRRKILHFVAAISTIYELHRHGVRLRVSCSKPLSASSEAYPVVIALILVLQVISVAL